MKRLSLFAVWLLAVVVWIGAAWRVSDVADAQSVLRVSEVDGSPDARLLYLRVPNGSLSITQAVGTLNYLAGLTVGNLNASSPVTLSAAGRQVLGGPVTVDITNASANGSTKGAATFTASDFNSSSGLISIDYANGQAATSSTKGFLTAADWVRFDAAAAGSGPWLAGGAGALYYNGGNVGIGDATPAALLTVGNGDQFKVDASGNVTTAGGVETTGDVQSAGTVYAGDAEITQHLLAGGNVYAAQLYAGNSDLEITASAITRLGSATTFTLLNTGFTTVNAFGAATALNLGAATGTTTITNTLAVNGNLTVGNASADTATVNAASWTLANDTNFVLSGGVNGLSFDTSTLSIDATNDRVGIGTAAPVNTVELQVASSGNVLSPFTMRNTGTAINTGTGMLFAAKDPQIFLAGITTLMTVATAGAESGELYFRTLNAGALGERMRILSDGKVGIGTTTVSSGQKLEVNGGLNLTTATAQPACSSTTRGTLWVVQSAAGVKDSVQVCAKDAANAYAWRTIY